MRSRLSRALAALALSAALGALLSACAASARPASHPDATASKSSSAAPSTWSLQRAGDEYLNMIAASNVDANALSSMPAGTALSDYVAALSLLSNDAGLFAQQLLSGDWPTAARPAIAVLVPAVKAEQAAVVAAMASTSVDQVTAALNQAAPVIADAKAKSAVVRTALGLPPT